MSARDDQRTVARLAVAMLAGGALAVLLELLARQAPYTFFALRLLPGPAAQLRGHLVAFGAVGLGVAATWPLAYPEPAKRGVTRSLVASHLALAIVLLAAALTNRMALQLIDPHPANIVFSVIRVVIEIWAIASYVPWARRLIRR